MAGTWLELSSHTWLSNFWLAELHWNSCKAAVKYKVAHVQGKNRLAQKAWVPRLRLNTAERAKPLENMACMAAPKTILAAHPG